MQTEARRPPGDHHCHHNFHCHHHYHCHHHHQPNHHHHNHHYYHQPGDHHHPRVQQTRRQEVCLFQQFNKNSTIDNYSGMWQALIWTGSEHGRKVFGKTCSIFLSYSGGWVFFYTLYWKDLFILLRRRGTLSFSIPNTSCVYFPAKILL